MKVLVRARILNGGELMLQRKALGGFWTILFLFPLRIVWKGPWRDWKLLDNEKYEKEFKIAKKLDEVKKLMVELKEIEAYLEREKKDVKSAIRNRLDYGEEQWITVKRKDQFYKRYPDINFDKKEDTKWRSMLSDKALGKAKPPNTRSHMNIPDHPLGMRGTTGYMSEKDAKNYSLSVKFDDDDLDSIISYRPPSNKGNNNSNGNKGSRKRRPNESPEEHQARLDEMDGR